MLFHFAAASLLPFRSALGWGKRLALPRQGIPQGKA